jgi:quercetin dioxygenase-like cupin family protein
MDEAHYLDEQDWRSLRPDVASEVQGTLLLREPLQLQLVRVAPGGGFAQHVDPYGHLFHFLEGEGVAQVEDRVYAATPGLTVRVAPGQRHSYKNTGAKTMQLLSANIP